MRNVALLVAMLVALVDTAPVRAGDGFHPDPVTYEQELAPYGSWVHDGEYGRVWQPTVAVGWRPYVNGYWGWGAAGWTWMSYEPFGWTFHYGRWGFTPAFGWVWVPGFVWGPAWVSWYWNAGYVGWAPISPFGAVVPYANFVFVREQHFCDDRLGGVVYASRSVPRHVFGQRARGFHRPPDVHSVAHAGGGTVRRVDARPHTTLAPWTRPGGQRVVERGPGSRSPADIERSAPGRRPRPPRPERFDPAAPGRVPHGVTRPRPDAHARATSRPTALAPRIARPERATPQRWRASAVPSSPKVLRGQGLPHEGMHRGGTRSYGVGGGERSLSRSPSGGASSSGGFARGTAPHVGVGSSLRGGAAFR